MPLTAAQLLELRQQPLLDGNNRVAFAIRLLDVTQVEVAEETQLPQQYVSDVARNRYRTITVENAQKFADFFGCIIEDLFPARDAEQVSA